MLHTADDGETKLSNLVELCGRHHRLLHEGALIFTRPDGARIPELDGWARVRGEDEEDGDVSAET